MVQYAFDASKVEPAKALEAIPTGWYPVAITESDKKQTKDKTGNFLEFGLTVADGPYKGRKVYDRFNVDNQNPQAVDIAYKQLSSICHAINVMQFTTTDALHNRLMEARVVKRPADGQYDEANEVKGYRALGAGPATAGNAPTPPTFMSAPPAAPHAQAAPPPPPPPPAPAPVAPPPAAFPPAGWVQHPQSPSHYYCGNEVLDEAALRARMAPQPQQGAPTVPPPAAPAQGNVPPWMT